MNSPKSHSKLVLWTSVLTIVPYCFYLYTFAPSFFWKTEDSSGSVHFTLPKLWTCVFRGTAQVGRKEPCSSPMSMKLHFWRLNLWDVDHFILKISSKICEVCWLQARTVCVFLFPPQIQRISALPTESDS